MERNLDLRRLRRASRPRRQRGRQPEEHGDEFHRNCPWRERLWPRARALDETGPGEAGTGQL